jgi:hypothetical protein
VQEFITTGQGYRLATSTGGVLTGRGADIILIDDPLKPEEALSEAQRNAANDWFVHALYSRLNDKCSGAIIIIMQRLHEDDLVGHVLALGPSWEVLGFPVIAEATRCTGSRRSGDRDASRAVRARLCTLTASRSKPWSTSGGPSANTTSPDSISNRRLRWRRHGETEWFRRYRENERPERFDRIVQSWDTANKATELSDFSACTTWGVSSKHLFLLGVFRRRLEYPALKRAVREQQRLFDATVVLIEDKASGTQLIRELIEDGCHGVTRYQPSTRSCVCTRRPGRSTTALSTFPRPRRPGSPNTSTK